MSNDKERLHIGQRVQSTLRNVDGHASRGVVVGFVRQLVAVRVDEDGHVWRGARVLWNDDAVDQRPAT